MRNKNKEEEEERERMKDLEFGNGGERNREVKIEMGFEMIVSAAFFIYSQFCPPTFHFLLFYSYNIYM